MNQKGYRSISMQWRAAVRLIATTSAGVNRASRRRIANCVRNASPSPHARQHAPRQLLGQRHRFIGQQPGHRRSSLRPRHGLRRHLSRAQQRRLQREHLADHIGQVGHDLLLLFQRRHESLAGHARSEQRHLLYCGQHRGFARQTSRLHPAPPIEAGGSITSSITRLIAASSGSFAIHRPLHHPAGDDQPVDLVCAFKDAVDPRIAVGRSAGYSST